MRRRGFVKALAAIPAAPVLLAQQPAPAAAPSDELPVLTPAAPEAVGDIVPRFFSPEQFAALGKVSDILMPATSGGVGGLDAQAPEFLDFLIGQSPAERQHVYIAGLDALNAHAKKHFGKMFAELDAAQADELLSPLRQPWTFDAPADPVAAFLREAKQDVRIATVNSRQYGGGNGNGGGRRFSGGGLYWYPLD